MRSDEPLLAAVPEGAFDGPRAFQAYVLAALAAAARENWREVVLSDTDFADWPLGERAMAEALQAWSGAGRSFTMLAQNFGVFERTHARFVHWRRLWGHIVDCRACDGPGLPRVPSGIWTPGWFLSRIDAERVRGICGRDPEGRRALRERIEECLRHAKPAFPATTLGL